MKKEEEADAVAALGGVGGGAAFSVAVDTGSAEKAHAGLRLMAAAAPRRQAAAPPQPPPRGNGNGTQEKIRTPHKPEKGETVEPTASLSSLPISGRK